MYIKSKKRIISENDLVKVTCTVFNEFNDEDEYLEVYPELIFSHGYTNELDHEIPLIIKSNLDKIIDRFSTVKIKLEKEDIKTLKLSDIKNENYLQITVIEVMTFDFKWNLSEAEKISISQLLKIRGNYKAGLKLWSTAFKNYHKAVKYLKDSVCLTDTSYECHNSAQDLLISCMNNAAFSCLKLKSGYSLCIKYCDHVLSLDQGNTKALFRKAKALYELKNYESTLESLDKCLSLETDGKTRNEISEMRTICYNKHKIQREKDKVLYQDIFDKIGEMARKAPNDEKSAIPYDIESWDNKMADEMLSITEELEAFGEELPPRIHKNHRNNDTCAIIEEDDFQ